MKRTQTITLVLLPILAIACGKDPHYQHCVDENDNVIDESNCNNLQPNGIYSHGPRWYYSPNWYGVGNRVSGGSYTPLAGRAYSFSSAGPRSSFSSISRGGFGSTGSSHSSFGSGE